MGISCNTYHVTPITLAASLDPFCNDKGNNVQKAELDRSDFSQKLTECRQQLEHTETAKMELTQQIQKLQNLVETHASFMLSYMAPMQQHH